jgi:hypothetical protein
VDLVFGYGSLVAVTNEPVIARLAGFRRELGVAMDNAVDLPGYKYFVRADDGSRPGVFVAFADLAETGREVPGPAVNGVLLPTPDLTALDARERNYERVDVSGEVEGAPPGARVWAYVGSASGRARFARGRVAGTLVVARAYVEAVQAAFRGLGPVEHRAFLESSDLGGVPVMALERVDL